jgi:hypothetical protein
VGEHRLSASDIAISVNASLTLTMAFTHALFRAQKQPMPRMTLSSFV